MPIRALVVGLCGGWYAIRVGDASGVPARWGDKLKALELLMKHLGLAVPETHQHIHQHVHFTMEQLQRMAVDDAFKEPDHPFRIAIVCAMWLTGFDVPSLSTLYLDKPLKAHTLMQAIARANRVYAGKTNGLVVDYCGILKHLRKALATFAGTGPDGSGGETDPTTPDEELLNHLAEAIALVCDFLDEQGASLPAVIQGTGFARNAAIVACKEAANQNDETRKRFEVMCREVFKRFKACVNKPAVNAHRAKRDAINVVYKSLQQDREKADISDIIRALQEIVDKGIKVRPDGTRDTTEPYDISRIDFERLKQEFEKSPSKNSTVQSLKESVDKKLRRLLAQNPLRTDFQEHYERLVADYNRDKDQVSIEQTFEALLKLVKELDEEERRALREGLTEESLALFDLLQKDGLNASEIKRVKAVASDLLSILKAEKLRIDQWREKEATRDAVKVEIQNFLWSDETGLPATYNDQEVTELTDEIFQHIYQAYPGASSPYYEAAIA